MRTYNLGYDPIATDEFVQDELGLNSTNSAVGKSFPLSMLKPVDDSSSNAVPTPDDYEEPDLSMYLAPKGNEDDFDTFEDEASGKKPADAKKKANAKNIKSKGKKKK